MFYLKNKSWLAWTCENSWGDRKRITWRSQNNTRFHSTSFFPSLSECIGVVSGTITNCPIIHYIENAVWTVTSRIVRIRVWRDWRGIRRGWRGNVVFRIRDIIRGWRNGGPYIFGALGLWFMVMIPSFYIAWIIKQRHPNANGKKTTNDLHENWTKDGRIGGVLCGK